MEIKDSTRSKFFSRFVVDPESGCWNWGGALSGGKYGVIRCDWEQFLAHRFSYILHYGDIPDGLLVRHKCDNTKCVNPQHLETGTQKQNIADMDERNRRNPLRGERHPSHKYSDELIESLRSDLLSGMPNKDAATKYGVSPALASMVKNGQKRTPVASS